MKALRVFTIVILLCGSRAYGTGEPVTYFVQTIIGTNREKSQDDKWKKVGPQLRKDLSPVFQWKHYWQVDCQKVEVREAKISRIQVTKERQLELEMRTDGQLELRLFRDGKLVRKTRDLVSHRRIIMGGDSSKDEAWFVVIRRDKPSTD